MIIYKFIFIIKLWTKKEAKNKRFKYKILLIIAIFTNFKNIGCRKYMNEKILYKNKTIITKSIFINGIKIYFKKRKIVKILRIIMIFLILICDLKYLVDKDYVQIFLFMPILLYILFMHKIFYFIATKKQKYTFNLEKTYRFYNNRLEIITDISKLTVAYDKIKFAFENDEAFYMIFEHSLICIDKNNFNINHDIDFNYFIKAKVNFK